MTELHTQFVHELLKPFSYAYKGEQVDASFITFVAPSSRNIKECAYLKQSFYRAIPKNSDTQKDDDTKGDKVDGEAILTLMSMSQDVDLDKILLTSIKLFISPNVAMVDGQAQLKQSHIDNIGYDDLEVILGKYLENFILASSLKKMNDKSQKK